MTTRESILEEALDLFNSGGYLHVSVRDIAAAVDISPGNLSYHFPKKDDILRALLENFSIESTKCYEKYHSEVPILFNVLKLLKNVFHVQYRYRGVYIGNQYVQQLLEEDNRFNYEDIVKQRLGAFSKIFCGLADNRQLILKKGDLDFLLAEISLFGRFWISESLLSDKNREESNAVNIYVALFAKLFSLFATDEGKSSIEVFRVRYLSDNPY
ncbi:MAG TPA: TetR/AcrR family transcriptional regulator [Membranihabitans sp.]|nr:TetR/AcrR family transcriptional regulator [Membranihabitans sp.]